MNRAIQSFNINLLINELMEFVKWDRQKTQIYQDAIVF